MADAKSSLARDGTMQVTAKEGITYLESQGKDKLLEMQGLKDPAPEKPAVQRDGTMAVTAKENSSSLEVDDNYKVPGLQEMSAENAEETKTGGNVQTSEKMTCLDTCSASLPQCSSEVDKASVLPCVKDVEADRILGKNRPDEDAKTRGQQHQIDDANREPEPPVKKPKMAKGVTMVGTAKEAEKILGDAKPDADAMTRGQQKKIDEITKEVPASPAKKPRMSKEGTMAATAKEAKAYYIGKDKLGDTRSESKALQSKPSPPKKMNSMARTVHESTYVVPDLDVNEGRRTRSQSKGETSKPAMKRAGTMQQTAKEGKNFLKRGRKSKKVSDEKEEDADAE